MRCSLSDIRRKENSVERSWNTLILLPVILSLFWGCGRQKNIRDEIATQLLRPFIQAIGAQDWEKVQQYLTEDIRISASDRIQESLPQRHSQGKALALIRLKKSPFRGADNITFTFSFPEVTANEATVMYEVFGVKKGDGKKTYLRSQYQLKIAKDSGQWLITTMTWEDFEAIDN